MADKTKHEWGYRYCWPPTTGNLTPRQRNKIIIAEQAEAYIKHKQRQQSQTETRAGSLSKEYFG